ncbi:hypothetical protein VT84_24000 [Gemmata sp. SH-PL17]|uniref:hypothetical protein n=1 Tax=Gemmata sp. SH-PL17 TaxID=1630693 RepID=UPI0004AFF7DB|nr:hypothetical protein [Gemmata sp. SH-PL17]AMV27485.1 hypothetical protein VT84_24000 [Gemmata sp. SH-PL17]
MIELLVAVAIAVGGPAVTDVEPPTDAQVLAALPFAVRNDIAMAKELLSTRITTATVDGQTTVRFVRRWECAVSYTAGPGENGAPPARFRHVTTVETVTRK